MHENEQHPKVPNGNQPEHRGLAADLAQAAVTAAVSSGVGAGTTVYVTRKLNKQDPPSPPKDRTRL